VERLLLKMRVRFGPMENKSSKMQLPGGKAAATLQTVEDSPLRPFHTSTKLSPGIVAVTLCRT